MAASELTGWQQVNQQLVEVFESAIVEITDISDDLSHAAIQAAIQAAIVVRRLLNQLQKLRGGPTTV